MPQHDYDIANGSGAAFRADLNAVLAAIASTNKGPSAPTAAQAGMLWVEDDNPSATQWTVRMYDGADWIAIGVLNATTNSFAPANALASTGGNLTGSLNIGTTGKTQSLYVSGNAAMNIATLTDAATITPDFGTANNFAVTLGGNRTLANPTNLEPGQSGVIFIAQDGTGSRTLAFGSSWDFPSATAPTLTTTASAVDVLVYSVRSSTSIAAQHIANIG